MIFNDLIVEKDGMIKGPFGGDVKKALFIPRQSDSYKVLEQSVVINRDISIGNYYLEKEYVEKKLKRFIVKNGDILITGAGTLGKLYEINNLSFPAVINQALIRIRVNNNVVDTSFFKYYFKYHIIKMISGINGDSVIPNLPPLDIIKKTRIDVPDIPTQQKIASVLSALDDKIELNNKINTELEAMAKTLYDYWFVQFEFPNPDGKPYKSSGGRMIFNETLKREIPEGWEVSVFNDWIKNTKTGDWGKDKIEGNYTERVYCVRGADINGLNGKGEVKAPERFILKNNLSKKLEPNDFIIEISGGSPTQSTARIAHLTKESFTRFDTDVVCSNFCKAVTLKDDIFAFNFQQEWQRLYEAGIFFGYEGKTSGIKNFQFDSFMESYYIVRPDKELAKKFNAVASDLEKKRQSNLKQNQELATLRDWLLPMLMNGQVKVG
ncbi:MAG: restriction endonuclease subunit S [Chryseobacterium sp.]|nr:restriction endonuclease subunit S [Chryseobacterium sp.]